MDIIVVWSCGDKKVSESERWTEHGGTLFLRAESKWARKDIQTDWLHTLRFYEV